MERQKVESVEDIVPGGRYWIESDNGNKLSPYNSTFTVVSKPFPAVNDKTNARQPHVAVVFDRCRDKEESYHICAVIPILRFGVFPRSWGPHSAMRASNTTYRLG